MAVPSEVIFNEWLKLENPKTDIRLDPIDGRMYGARSLHIIDVTTIAEAVGRPISDVLQTLSDPDGLENLRRRIRQHLVKKHHEAENGTPQTVSQNRPPLSLDGNILRHKTIVGLEFVCMGTFFKDGTTDIDYVEVEFKRPCGTTDNTITLTIPYDTLRREYVAVVEIIRPL